MGRDVVEQHQQHPQGSPALVLVHLFKHLAGMHNRGKRRTDSLSIADILQRLYQATDEGFLLN
jgi:hypothetical protein